MNKVALITGASAGIGKKTALLFIQSGYIVYGIARRIQAMQEIQDAGGKVIATDVSSEESMQNCIRTVLAQEKRIDVLVNNAGYGLYGAIEDVSIEAAKAQFDVNVFGLAYMTKLVLPQMRKQKQGLIINVSSMGGKISIPLGGWYHSSKFAVEGLSDALREEVRPFGVKVVLVEPGAIQSEWGDITLKNLNTVSGQTDYAPIVKRITAVFSNTYNSSVSSAKPDVIAKLILNISNKRKPKARYAAPLDAKSFLFFRKLLPDSVFYGFLRFYMKLPKSI